MIRTAAVLALASMIMVSCQTKETGTQSTLLDDRKLVLMDVEQENRLPKKYKPVSLQVAKSIIPFPVKFPAEIPPGYHDMKRVEIQNWGKRERIALEAKLLPQESIPNNKGVYTLRIANFSDIASNLIERRTYEKRVLL